MLSQGVINDRPTQSILGSLSVLNPESTRHKRNIVADLLLTALIDAFSILVIFLLMSFSSTGEILFVGKGTELPKSSQAAQLERFPVVKVDEGKVYLEDQLVTADGLTAALLDLRKKYAESHPGEEDPGILTVQADRRVKYEILNQIVVAASQAGFSDLKFAAIIK